MSTDGFKLESLNSEACRSQNNLWDKISLKDWSWIENL